MEVTRTLLRRRLTYFPSCRVGVWRELTTPPCPEILGGQAGTGAQRSHRWGSLGISRCFWNAQHMSKCSSAHSGSGVGWGPMFQTLGAPPAGLRGFPSCLQTRPSLPGLHGANTGGTMLQRWGPASTKEVNPRPTSASDRQTAPDTSPHTAGPLPVITLAGTRKAPERSLHIHTHTHRNPTEHRRLLGLVWTRFATRFGFS